MWVRSAYNRYLVNLKPFGFDFRRETLAGSTKEALNNVLFYYFGKDKSRLSLYIWDQQNQLGLDGWQRRMDEAVSEVESEEPVESMVDLLDTEAAFKKTTDKDHPGARVAQAWKTHHPFTFATIDKIQKLFEDAHDAIISAKLDGELVCVYYENNHTVLVTQKGTVRSGLPATEEISKLLKERHCQRLIGLAEIYAVDYHNKPMSYMRSASIIKSPTGADENRVRVSVFDLVVVNKEDVATQSMESRIKQIQELFKGGKFVQPLYVTRGGSATIQDLWDQLAERGWEGLVVHVGDVLYKVKPILSLDMQIVAINKSDKFVDQISAILVACLDKDGRYRFNGMVGGGFNDTERAQLKQWADKNKVSEDDKRIWVDPTKDPLIVEVEVMEVSLTRKPALRFKDSKWVTVEDQMCATLRFPQFQRLREDKSNTYEDIKVEQIPGITASLLHEGHFIQTVDGHQGKILRFAYKDYKLEPNFELIVQWMPPIAGELAVSNCHPSEVIKTWK